MNNFSYKEAAALLRERNGFVVFTHANPDGDTIGSAAALVRILRSMGKRAVAVCADKIPDKLSFLAKDDIFADALPEIIETAVAVDVASQAMLGALGDFCAGREFDLVIDHHKISSLPGKAKLVKADYIANGEIIYELVSYLDLTIDRDIAEALYSAICSDSGGFKYANTRAETYECAAALVRTGIDFPAINRRLFEQKTPAQIALEKAAYVSLGLYHGGRLAVVGIDKETVEACGAKDSDFDSVNQIPRQILGVEVSAVIRPRDDGVKVSLRSNEYCDVAEIAKKYGGGGHIHAAGYWFKGSVVEAKEALIKDTDGCF